MSLSQTACCVLCGCMGLPGGSDVKKSACNAGDPGSISGWGRSPEEGNSNPLQYSCLENSMKEEPGGLQSMGSQRIGNTFCGCIFNAVYSFIMPMKKIIIFG